MFRRRRSGVGAPITAPGGINSSRHLMPLMSTLFMLQEWNTSYTKGEKEKMRKYALTMLVAGLGLAASLGSAKAVTIQFDYNSAFSPNPVHSSIGTTYLSVQDGSAASQGVPTNVRTVDLVPHSTGAGSAAARSFNVHFTDVTTISGVMDTDSGDTYSAQTLGNDHIDLAGDLTGTLKGGTGPNSSTVNFSHLVFTGPTSIIFVDDFNSLKTITIGAANLHFTNVGAPNAQTPNGTINFDVNGVASASTPEPGAMAMVVGMAIPGSLLALRLRRRNK